MCLAAPARLPDFGTGVSAAITASRYSSIVASWIPSRRRNVPSSSYDSFAASMTSRSFYSALHPLTVARPTRAPHCFFLFSRLLTSVIVVACLTQFDSMPGGGPLQTTVSRHKKRCETRPGPSSFLTILLRNAGVYGFTISLSSSPPR